MRAKDCKYIFIYKYIQGIINFLWKHYWHVYIFHLCGCLVRKVSLDYTVVVVYWLLVSSTWNFTIWIIYNGDWLPFIISAIILASVADMHHAGVISMTLIKMLLLPMYQ